MQNEKDPLLKPDVVQLSNELIYRRYLLNKDQIHKFSGELSIPEYIILHIIAENSQMPGIYSGRTYLKDLSEKMQITIRNTSKMISGLKERGLVVWSHDGDGSEGTYVTITDSGKKLLASQQEILKDYYGRVIEKYGTDNLIRLLQLMKQLETVMSSELERMEAEDGHENDCE